MHRHHDRGRRREQRLAGPQRPTRAELLVGQLTGRRGPAPGLLHERRNGTERRRHSAWSFFYGGLRPRRRFGRRAGDEHRTFLDWHEPGVLYLALAILLMSCTDALFTLNLLAVGGEELNVVMRLLLGQGPGWFVWVKITLTAASLVVLATVARRRLLGRVPVVALIWLFAFAYAVLIGWEIYLLGWHATGVGEAALEDMARWVAG
ncbi:MAG: hypothetical protein IT486_09865 [Gammaproteobacteria bacterium]|nr:hypothetical protein [Gammaproteobacteria bacterium]